MDFQDNSTVNVDYVICDASLITRRTFPVMKYKNNWYLVFGMGMYKLWMEANSHHPQTLQHLPYSDHMLIVNVCTIKTRRGTRNYGLTCEMVFF